MLQMIKGKVEVAEEVVEVEVVGALGIVMMVVVVVVVVAVVGGG